MLLTEEKRPRLIACALLALVALRIYYGFIDGSFRRPESAAFHPPGLLADEAAKRIGASWRTVETSSADGTRLRGWLFRPALPNGKAVLLMHETGGTRLNVMTHVPWLLERGFICLAADGRGHGASDGQLVTAGLLEGNDVVSWTGLLHAEPGVRQVYGLGHSLGASALIPGLALGAAMQAAGADSTGADMPTRYNLLAERIGLPVGVVRPALWLFFEPALWNARLRYGVDLERISPLTDISLLRAPVLLIHGTRDEMIPIGQARRMHAANPGATELWEVAGAGHVQAAVLQPAEYRARVLAWFK